MLHERPIECGECKKSISILYTQIKDGTFSNISMCKQCPQLKQSLHYTLISSQDSNEKNLSLAGELCCGNCGTTLESIRRGGALGCAECYIVFYDMFITIL